MNDWNIVHFHLSRRFRDDGFVKRSNYQIFAWITDDCIYMIQVYPHKADFLYCKKELLNIVERNFSIQMVICIEENILKIKEK